MTHSLVSVIISDLFERYLPETIMNLRATADGPVEILVETDEDGQGMRHCLNVAANRANGEYLFKVDGHCIMSPHWDTLMKEVCQANDMVVACIREIDDETWTVRDKGFDFVTIKPDLNVVKTDKQKFNGEKVAETMASIGCAWMIHKDRFNELEQNWEELGRLGALGVEWALKIWLSGGRTLVHKDVICGHLFRYGGTMKPNDLIFARKILGQRFANMQGPQQIHPLNWLAERFNKKTETVKDGV